MADKDVDVLATRPSPSTVTSCSTSTSSILIGSGCAPVTGQCPGVHVGLQNPHCCQLNVSALAPTAGVNGGAHATKGHFNGNQDREVRGGALPPTEWSSPRGGCTLSPILSHINPLPSRATNMTILNEIVPIVNATHTEPCAIRARWLRYHEELGL